MQIVRAIRTHADTPACPLGSPEKTAAILTAFNVVPTDTDGIKNVATLVALAEDMPDSPCNRCKGCQAVAALESQFATLN